MRKPTNQVETVEVMVIPHFDFPCTAFSVTIGAYNREADSIELQVTAAYAQYVQASELAGARLSLADFVMYLLNEAAVEHANKVVSS